MIVRPTGPTNHPLLAIVGEAPGVHEEREGKPFVGPSGFLLTQMLSAAGISRADCYFTNVLDWRPPNNDFNTLYNDGSKRRLPSRLLCDGRARLWRELQEVQPSVIIAVGNESLRSLTERDGVSDYRGTIIERNDTNPHIRVLPTYHPAYILRSYGDRPIVESDFRKSLRQAKTPYTPEANFITRPSFEQVQDFFNAGHRLLAFDIETIGACTRCLGFAWSDTNAISIPLIWKGSHYWSSEEEHLIIESFNSLLASSEVKKFIQNAPFDTTIVARELGLHTDGVLLDTMFAHHLLFPELPKGLDFLSSIYTDWPMYWGDERFSGDQNTAEYNCYDCCATFTVGNKILQQLEERGLTEFYHTTIHPAIFALTRMQNRGMSVDEKVRAELRTEYEAKLSTARATLSTAVGADLNPDSPKQVKELVYEKWKLPIQRKARAKTPTTDDDALKALGRRYPNHSPILHTILKCRHLRKVISTYIEMQASKDGRIHTSYNLAGTVTGRISSGKTIFGEGGNLQNILRGPLRRMYVAEEGKVLVKADLKQAEYMAVCWFARITDLIHQYTHNPSFDIHRYNASQVYSIPQEAVTKKQRDDSKNGVYAGNYGVGALKISRLYDIPLEDAKFILTRYHTFRPEIKEVYQSEIASELRRTRAIRNPLGRERIFFGRMDDELLRAAYSHKPQSTVADIILRAIIALDALGVELLLQVHDEIICTCLLKDVDETVRMVRAAMEQTILVPGVDTPLVIPAEISIGPNWFDTLPYKEWKLQHP